MVSRLDTLPQAFVWRRLHSLTGLWFVLFLVEHLITNSQAALLLGDSGKGFVRMVNLIHNLPYLTVIEVAFLGIPILIHTCWGIRYALTAKPNSMRNDGSKPYLKYNRNHAYTWQRITSWILVVLLILHIVKFRFLEYPHTLNGGAQPTYYVTVTTDSGLYAVADRLNVKLYNEQKLKEEDSINALTSIQLKPRELVAVAPTFGTASLLTVRDTFKSPVWGIIYTVFVLSACFHAFNGLWTSMLTWGWVIRESAQTGARKVAIALMLIIAFLGLAAVWGSYFLNPVLFNKNYWNNFGVKTAIINLRSLRSIDSS